MTADVFLRILHSLLLLVLKDIGVIALTITMQAGSINNVQKALEGQAK